MSRVGVDEEREGGSGGPLRAKVFPVLNYNLQLTDNRERAVRIPILSRREEGMVNGESRERGTGRSPDGSFDFADHDFSNRSPTWQRFRAAVKFNPLRNSKFPNSLSLSSIQSRIIVRSLTFA